ncbi:hypothetical protein Hdeb2414_s0012g00395241 [Helianthus debilis subsp. tardiflorus]
MDLGCGGWAYIYTYLCVCVCVFGGGGVETGCRKSLMTMTRLRGWGGGAAPEDDGQGTTPIPSSLRDLMQIFKSIFLSLIILISTVGKKIYFHFCTSTI